MPIKRFSITYLLRECSQTGHFQSWLINATSWAWKGTKCEEIHYHKFSNFASLFDKSRRTAISNQIHVATVIAITANAIRQNECQSQLLVLWFGRKFQCTSKLEQPLESEKEIRDNDNETLKTQWKTTQINNCIKKEWKIREVPSW
jgi:hypothetical protein